jgi:[ribosomal protein S5]-alanine N-acetyltransferase
MVYVTESPRLRFRLFEETDAPAMFDLNSDPEVVRYTGDAAFDDLSGAQQIVAYVQSQYAQYGFGRWVVERKDTGEIIGWCGLKYLADEDAVDLGYRYFRKHWGQGFGYEAGAACLEYGATQLGLEEIIGRAVLANVASAQILERLGFVFEKEEEKARGQGLVFGLFRWQKNKSNA